MDIEADFRGLLTTAGFGQRPRNAIVEFCAENLRELASLPSKELDTAISNLHKALATLPPPQRVRLNASRIMLLHAIRQHFLDRLHCQAELEAADIQALQPDDIADMRTEYLELVQTDNATTGLDPITRY